jgi:di/tripeptidase
VRLLCHKLYGDHPEIKHGTIKVSFTPDEKLEEVTEKINLEK